MSETDALIARVRSLSPDGANVHTVNKAVFYLQRADRADIIKPLVVIALITNDWRPVKEAMRGWW